MSIPLLGAGSATSGSGAFTPNALPNLTFWVTATTGLFQNSDGTVPAVNDADPVGFWQDQSPNGNNVIQAGATARPLLKLNIKNSLPILRFDGTNDFLSNVAPLGFSGADRSIFIITKKTANVASGMLVVLRTSFIELRYNGAGTIPERLINGGANNLDWSGATGNVNFILLDTTNNNAGATASIDVNAGTAVTAADSSANTVNTLSIGARPAAANFLNGDIGEVVIYNRTLSAGEITQVRNYLNAKWAIF